MATSKCCEGKTKLMPNPTGKRIIVRAVPVDPRLVLYGGFWGLFVSLTGYFGLSGCECGGDVDLAGSRGIAGFVSAAVGVFIGSKLTMLVMWAFRGWVARLEARLVVCRQRLSRLTGETEPGSSPDERQMVFNPLVIRLLFYSFILGGGFGYAGVGSVAVIIEAGTTGIYDSVSYLAIYVSLAVALFGILGIASELAGIARAVSRTEQRLDDAESVPISPVMERPRYADAAIQTVQSWLHKLTGVQGWQPGRVAP